jgi:hypothetical protein
VLEAIATNEVHLDDTMATLVAAAIIWLARTSPAGDVAGTRPKHIHYEITDTGPAAPPGSGGKNFRLMMR